MVSTDHRKHSRSYYIAHHALGELRQYLRKNAPDKQWAEERVDRVATSIDRMARRTAKIQRLARARGIALQSASEPLGSTTDVIDEVSVQAQTEMPATLMAEAFNIAHIIGCEDRNCERCDTLLGDLKVCDECGEEGRPGALGWHEQQGQMICPACIAAIPTEPLRRPIKMTNRLRRALLWVLHQRPGGYSHIGQTARQLLGMSQFEPMSDSDIKAAEKFADEDPSLWALALNLMVLRQRIATALQPLITSSIYNHFHAINCSCIIRITHCDNDPAESLNWRRRVGMVHRSQKAGFPNRHSSDIPRACNQHRFHSGEVDLSNVVFRDKVFHCSVTSIKRRDLILRHRRSNFNQNTKKYLRFNTLLNTGRPGGYRCNAAKAVRRGAADMARERSK